MLFIQLFLGILWGLCWVFFGGGLFFSLKFHFVLVCIDSLLLWQQNQAKAKDLVVTHSSLSGFTPRQRPRQKDWFLVTDDMCAFSFFPMLPTNPGILPRALPTERLVIETQD